MGQSGSRGSAKGGERGEGGKGGLRRSVVRASRDRLSLSRHSSRSSRSPALSHSYSVVTHVDAGLVNVNSATEEQLMTLPGVSRSLAVAIVEHRLNIGRFRRIDDVALVSGMGAERLNQIRAEICVRKTMSNASSRTQSLDSIRSSDSSRYQLNVNTASVFRLQCVPGLNQELAANIVDYRHKKGEFKSLDDLIKVKGMDKIRLSGIKSRLSLYSAIKSNESFNDSERGGYATDTECSKILPYKNNIGNGTTFGPKINGHRKTLSMPLKYTPNFVNGFSLNSVNDIFDLLSAYSHRPVIESEFYYTRHNKLAFRIATWNLYELSREKANNPGFREVACRTILENRFSIISIQDILDEEALKIICDELNAPILRRIIEWKDNSRKWQYYFVNKTYLNCKNIGFIYETYNSDIYIEIMKGNEKHSDTSQAPNFNYGHIEFKINDSVISLLNVQLTERNPEYSMTLLCEMIDKLLNMNKKVLIVGDFCSVIHIKDLSTCYKSAIDPYTNTLVNTTHGSTRNGAGGILMANEDIGRFTGISGVVRSGLCHLAIPCGWTWGGPSSPFCPVWAEFYIV
ncbi:endonuclease/exonuclease/phosphatase family domain-containing protein 1-like [Arctopsyche grandis]|uniref:endonuclease/exonuclease/phosphatase family domain-containing protein 1-like n=1 Tax=Arctopsyche grandis TaxID=121162 RepID=UPI00406DA2B1